MPAVPPLAPAPCPPPTPSSHSSSFLSLPFLSFIPVSSSPPANDSPGSMQCAPRVGVRTGPSVRRKGTEHLPPAPRSWRETGRSSARRQRQVDGRASPSCWGRNSRHRGRWPFPGRIPPLSTGQAAAGAGRREHLEREAGRLLQAAGLAVDTSDEGDPGTRVGAQVEVVVDQLAPLHEQERALLVRGQLLGGEAHDGVGDCARLQDTERQGTPGTPRASGPGRASTLPSPPTRHRRPALTRGTGKPPRLTPGVQP